MTAAELRMIGERIALLLCVVCRERDATVGNACTACDAMLRAEQCGIAEAVRVAAARRAS
jgi:hypothetical protein